MSILIKEIRVKTTIERELKSAVVNDQILWQRQTNILKQLKSEIRSNALKRKER